MENIKVEWDKGHMEAVKGLLCLSGQVCDHV